MTTYEVAAIASAIVASLVAYAFFRTRHHCTQHDPLCTRKRPCLHCYRELFKETMEK
jgi:hypothetical protein